MAPTEEKSEKDQPPDPASGDAGAQRLPTSTSPLSEDEAKALQDVQTFMKDNRLREAGEGLRKMLEKRPNDPMLLHNLAVVLMDLGELAEAETVFWNAFEQNSQDGKQVIATMYGLATVLTEQGDTPKLMQAEALLRHVLEQTCQKPEMAPDTYRSFVGLANNCAKQKKWDVAAQAWGSAIALGSSMFGEESELVVSHKTALARAEKLARWQARLRIVMWGLAICIPILIAWYMYSSGFSNPVTYGEQSTSHAVESEVAHVELSSESPIG